MTAEMHLALAEAFGMTPGSAAMAQSQWAGAVEDIAARLAGASELMGQDLVAAAGPLLAQLGTRRRIPAPRSGSTATITLGRSCKPIRAGTCWTSKANLPNRWRSAPRPPRRSKT